MSSKNRERARNPSNVSPGQKALYSSSHPNCAKSAEFWTEAPRTLESRLVTLGRKKAPLQCLIGRVKLLRSAPDTVGGRIISKGGDASSLVVPNAVNSLAGRNLVRRGRRATEIARELTRRRKLKLGENRMRKGFALHRIAE
jgi:hypothetical protein